jgi:hypothetical protein
MIPFLARFERLPTADLYVLNPLAVLKRSAPRLPKLRRIAKTLYVIGRTGIVVRYGEAADIAHLRKAGAARLVYVADDDFAAGGADPSLPQRYRERLAAFAATHWPTLREAADIVVVPGTALAEEYGAKARIVLPLWERPPADLAHFDSPERLEIAYLGTASHVGDFAEIAPLVADALTKCRRDVRLTLFLGEATPAELARHARVNVRAPMSWWRYRRALRTMRFHLALYPLRDTAFNRARSASKFHEHALIGAASLMSPNAALKDAAGDFVPGLFVEGNDWAARLDEALADLDSLRRRAEATRARIAATDPGGAAAKQWAEILADEL